MIEQVVTNLAVNARDAMPTGGELVIRTERRELGAEASASIAGTTPGPYVGFRVADTGIGIHPEALPRIFEPFFTTKETGRGTGLGLATVFGIVKQHHGWITARNQPGSGAEFEVFLPAASGPADNPEAQPSRNGSRRLRGPRPSSWSKTSPSSEERRVWCWNVPAIRSSKPATAPKPLLCYGNGRVPSISSSPTW